MEENGLRGCPLDRDLPSLWCVVILLLQITRHAEICNLRRRGEEGGEEGEGAGNGEEIPRETGRGTGEVEVAVHQGDIHVYFCCITVRVVVLTEVTSQSVFSSNVSATDCCLLQW